LKKVLFALITSLFLLLSACASNPREESPTLNHLMENNEELNSRIDEGTRKHKFTNNPDELEGNMLEFYEILEEEFGDEFYVYVSITGGTPLKQKLKHEPPYTGYLVVKPKSETAKLFKDYLDGNVNASDWRILKQNMTESTYGRLYEGKEDEQTLQSVYFYDAYLHDPPVLAAFPNVRTEVIEFE